MQTFTDDAMAIIIQETMKEIAHHYANKAIRRGLKPTYEQLETAVNGETPQGVWV